MDKESIIYSYLRELLESFGQGLDALTYTLSKLLKLPIIVANPAYETISTTLLHPDLDAFQVEYDEERENNKKPYFCTIKTDTLQLRGFGRAIASTDRVLGYIFLIIDKVEDPDLDFYETILESAESLYANCLKNQLELKQEKNKSKDAFFYDLLYGNLKRNEDIINRGEVWGWDFRRPYAVLLLTVPDVELFSPDRHLIDVLQKIAERVLIGKYLKNPATTVNRNEVIALVPLELERKKQSEQKQEITTLIRGTLNQIVNTELNNRIACGVGQTYYEPINLFRSYQEAKIAIDMGGLLGVEIPFFSDMGLERVLYKHDVQDLKEYHDQVLGELLKNEPEEGLLEILKIFTINQFDVNKTAQDLFMHRNTLRTRLSKIETILDRPLDDMNTRLDLTAVLKIEQLHRLDQESE
ncbi:sugar diacid utilization regulator [Desulfitobacterium hafniense]|uniref:Sugar diacid utilization regulator n=1 Tax=Desulfitobacterium hafniense TaxID=49338 RepID=A0A0W1JFU8_DESHA|nr:helix-turn-helix domain-containing protein [Desulfitobacterium hafniense]KTE90306.1 sugar diacid utilization regulator [Desulfitobacterium hafniense]